MVFLDYRGLSTLVDEIKKYMSDVYPSSSVDSSLSTASTNAVQNNVITNALNGKANNTQTFTVSNNRENISSGETVSTIFGKIAKWYSDLKTVAFSGSYNDLSNKPTIPTRVSELTNDSNYATTSETDILQEKIERYENMLFTGIVSMNIVTDDNIQITTNDGDSISNWWRLFSTYSDETNLSSEIENAKNEAIENATSDATKKTEQVLIEAKAYTDSYQTDDTYLSLDEQS